MTMFPKRLAALALAASTAIAPVHAQIPVTDILANINWLQQLLDNITDVEIQLDSLQSQYQNLAAITGDRGFGSLYRNPGLDSYLPPNVQEIVDSTQRGIEGLTPEARVLRGAGVANPCAGMPDATRTVCEAQIAGPFQNAALLRRALDLQRLRSTQIRGLLDQVGRATDPAAAAQLNVRIEGEMAAATQADGQIATLRALVENDERIAAARRRETMLQNLSRPGGLTIKTDPNVF